MISKKHKTIFGTLFSIVLLLLLSEIVIEKVFPGTAEKPAVTKYEVDTVFINTLMNFGFKKEWYKLKDGSYYVSLPNDLPAELIMMDLAEYFKNIRIISNQLDKIANL